MIKVGSAGIRDRIELTDDDLETSEVISGLFDIIKHDKNILDIGGTHIYQKHVVQFAQKYDFAVELRIIRYQLHNAVSPADPDK